MSVELIPAPGVADSASSLSYPYTNELVNSIIKANVYISVGDEDLESFSALGAYGVFDADIDFRKCLHIDSYQTSSIPVPAWIWGCGRLRTCYVGTFINWVSLDDFDVDEFKIVSVSPNKFP